MRIEQAPTVLRRIREIHTRLVSCFGHQKDWWPAESPFETLLGAVLVQHTRWFAVAKVLDRLRCETRFDPKRLLEVRVSVLESWLRPAGCHHQKAHRIRALSAWCGEQGFGRLAHLPTALLRE
ncbi:HhH-GPD family protein, partial [mine drainage metagenome]